MQSVAEILAEAIAELGRGGQARVAREFGVDDGTVTRWMKGHAKPDEKRWSKLEQFLGLPKGSLREASRATSEEPTNAVLAGKLDELHDLVAELVDIARRQSEAGRALQDRTPSSTPRPDPPAHELS